MKKLKKRLVQKIIPKIKYYLKHNIPQIFQLVFFIVSTCLSFSQLNLQTNISAVVFISLCLFMKIGRIAYNKQICVMITASLSFYYGFLLTAFQNLFYYQGLSLNYNTYEQKVDIYLVITYNTIRNINFSLLLHINLASYVQLVVYLVAELFLLLVYVLDSVQLLRYYELGGCQNNNCGFQKDCVLLSVGTSISITSLLLDFYIKLFKQKKQQLQKLKIKQVKKKQQQMVELQRSQRVTFNQNK